MGVTTVFSQLGIGYLKGSGEKNIELKNEISSIVYYELHAGANSKLIGAFSDYAFTLYIGRSQVRYAGRRGYDEWETGCMVSPPGSEGSIQLEAESKFRTVLISRRFVEAVIDDLVDYRRFIIREAPSDNFPIVRNLLGALQSAASTEPSISQTFLESVAVALICATAGRLQTRSIQIPLSPARMRSVIEFVEDNLSQSLSLTQIAGGTGLKVRQLTYDFKQAYGMPLYRYVLQRRVDRAIIMLRLGLPVVDVASLVGFDSRTSLSRAIHNLAGITTTDARNGARPEWMSLT